MYGQTRIFFAMARDGLIPEVLARIGADHRHRGDGVFAAGIAGFVPLKNIARVANAGTLMAFIATALAMLVLRRTDPDRPRAFRCRPWVVGRRRSWAAASICSSALQPFAAGLPGGTRSARSSTAYARGHSLLGKAAA